KRRRTTRSGARMDVGITCRTRLRSAHRPANDAEASYAVAYALLERKRPRAREAAHWLERAAALRHADAQGERAHPCGTGRGKRRDAHASVRWLRRAAAQGNARALVNLGAACAVGAGVAKDRAEANRLYRAAAARGNAVAMKNLGLVYLHGRGVRTDVHRAIV